MIKAGIVCGCLPVQSGIKKPDLYHHVLAEKVFVHYKLNLIISSIWYTKIDESVTRAEELIANENPDVVFYHVRPDPYLNLSKLIYRFRDHHNSLRFLLNLKCDETRMQQREYTERNSKPEKKKSLWRTWLRELNYGSGYFTGINRQVIQKEKRMLEAVADLCHKKNKYLIIVGPASRPRSGMENFLLRQLEKKLAEVFKNTNFHYVTCYGDKGKNNENLFFEDGIHVNKAGHKRMAELIFPQLSLYIAEKKLMTMEQD